MRSKRESGQVIVLMVFGVITLLGFSALAIDGARLFSEQRNLAGVSDTAAFTAASYVGSYQPYTLYTNWFSGLRIEPHAEQAALEIIRKNGYTDQDYNPFGGNDLLMIDVRPITPGTEFTSYIVEITILSEVKPIFAQLVYHKPIMANAYSEAIVWPKMNMAYGRALFATAPEGARRIEFIGNSYTHIHDSGIFSNSNHSDSIYISGSAITKVDGAVTSVGGVYYSFGLLNAGSVQVNAQPLSLAPIPGAGDCSSLSTSVESFDAISGITWHTTGRIITPTNISSGHHIFASGWYCISEDFLISGGNVESETGGVMFYFPEGNSSFTISGGVVDLKAAQLGEANDSAGNNWNGMLIFIDNLNTGTASLNPDPTSHLEGSIYAPGPPLNDANPKCALSGNGETEPFELQIICYSIKITGNTGFRTNYVASKFYESPVTVNLEE